MTYRQVVVVVLSELLLDGGLVERLDGGGAEVGAFETRSARRHRLLRPRSLCWTGVSERSGQHQTDRSGRPARRLLAGDEGQFRSSLTAVERVLGVARVVAGRGSCEGRRVLRAGRVRVTEWTGHLLLRL